MLNVRNGVVSRRHKNSGLTNRCPLSRPNSRPSQNHPFSDTTMAVVPRRISLDATATWTLLVVPDRQTRSSRRTGEAASDEVLVMASGTIRQRKGALPP